MQILDDELRKLEADTAGSLTPIQAKQYAGAIRELPFVGLIALLAADSFEPTKGKSEDLIDRAATDAASRQDVRVTGIESVSIKNLLVKIFNQRVKPKDALQDDKLRDLLLKAGIKEMTKRAIGTSLEFDQIQEIVNILDTGKFFGDASSLLRAVFYSLDAFPTDVLETIEDDNFVSLPANLLTATVRDTTGFPAELTRALNGMTNPADKSPEGQTLNNVFGELKKVPLTRRSFVLLRSPLNPQNRSARLAIILYARANGIMVSEEKLNNLYDSLEPSDKSRGLLLKDTLDVLAHHFGVEPGLIFLRGLGALR